jgi:hypothetical protein
MNTKVMSFALFHLGGHLSLVLSLLGKGGTTSGSLKGVVYPCQSYLPPFHP